jgi:hypothetical protein
MMETEQRLIDANKLEVKMCGLCDEFGTDHLFIDAIVYEIGNAPTVDAVEVVHGRWIMKETMIRSPFAKNAYCSVCLEETSDAHNYCPNCGAKIDGDENG